MLICISITKDKLFFSVKNISKIFYLNYIHFIYILDVYNLCNEYTNTHNDNFINSLPIPNSKDINNIVYEL